MKLPKYSDKWRVLTWTDIFTISFLFGMLCAFLMDRLVWHGPANYGIFTWRYLQHLSVFLVGSTAFGWALDKYLLVKPHVCPTVLVVETQVVLPKAVTPGTIIQSLGSRQLAHDLDVARKINSVVGRKPYLSNAEMESYTFIHAVASVGQAVDRPMQEAEEPKDAELDKLPSSEPLPPPSLA